MRKKSEPPSYNVDETHEHWELVSHFDPHYVREIRVVGRSKTVRIQVITKR